MKKRMTALLLALVMLMAGCTVFADETQHQPQKQATAKPAGTVNEGATSEGFTDVPEDSFYFEAVNWAVEEKITEGLTNTTFGPDAQCNRAQVVTFLWRLDGKPAASGENVFTDVEAGSWYEDAVLWAVENQVTNGMGEGIFMPTGICNRAQIVSFLWKYAGKPASDAEMPFTDVEEGSWYAEAVAWAVEKGITSGLTETTFGPSEPCNRAQIVTFLYRYDDKIQEQPDVTEPTEPQPTESQPTEPKPTEPKPTEPKPAEPKPTEPKPTEPKPTEPKPTEPEPTEPQPTEPPVTPPTEDPNMGEWA